MERNQNTLKVTETINDTIKTELNKSNFVFDDWNANTNRQG